MATLKRVVLIGLVLMLLPAPAQAQARADVAKLIGGLEDPDPAVRASAALQLGVMGTRASSAVPALERTLGDEEREVAKLAAWALGRTIERKGAPLTLYKMSQEHEHPSVRQAAHSALKEISARYFRGLLTDLRGGCSDERFRAATSLASMGSGMRDDRAEAAIPALIDALGDNGDVGMEAARALGEIGPRAVPALTKALSDPSPSVRFLAIASIRVQGSQAQEAAPSLADLLGDEDQRVREAAATALKELGLQLRFQGVVLWWVVPLAYWKTIALGFLAVSIWSVFAGLLVRRLRLRRTRQLVLSILLSTPLALLMAYLTASSLTSEWVEGFLPQPPLVRTSASTAAALTAALGAWLACAAICLGVREPRQVGPPNEAAEAGQSQGT